MSKHKKPKTKNKPIRKKERHYILVEAFIVVAAALKPLNQDERLKVLNAIESFYGADV